MTDEKTYQTLITKNTNRDESGRPAPKPMSTLELLKAPGVSMVLLLYGLIMFVALAFTASKSNPDLSFLIFPLLSPRLQ